MTIPQRIAAMPLTERIELMYHLCSPDQRHLYKHKDIIDELDILRNDLFSQMFKNQNTTYQIASKTAAMTVINMIMNPQASEKSDFNPDKITVVQLYDSHENHAGLYVTDILDENKVAQTIQSVFASVDANASEHTDIQLEADDLLAEHHGIYRKIAIPVDVEEI